MAKWTDTRKKNAFTSLSLSIKRKNGSGSNVEDGKKKKNRSRRNNKSNPTRIDNHKLYKKKATLPLVICRDSLQKPKSLSFVVYPFFFIFIQKRDDSDLVFDDELLQDLTEEGVTSSWTSSLLSIVAPSREKRDAPPALDDLDAFQQRSKSSSRSKLAKHGLWPAKPRQQVKKHSKKDLHSKIKETIRSSDDEDMLADASGAGSGDGELLLPPVTPVPSPGKRSI